jgi:hypothetical protein
VTLDFTTSIKLVLALAGFLLVARYGSRDKRIVGVLLTFPLLNGMALLTSPDPMRVASVIYPLVIFNSILFWVAVSSVQWVPPNGSALPRHFLLMLRVIAWGVTWGFIGYLITENHDKIPSGPIWFSACGAIVVAIMFALWRQPGKDKTVTAESSWRHWVDWSVRVALFVLAFLCLAYVAQNASDQKWVGMAGAFPLPGIFAIASLSVTSRADQLKPIRDTVLLGPMLVIPFTWLFGHLVLLLPAGYLGTIIGIGALVAAWTISFAVVVWVVPILERRLDSASR